MSTFFKQYLKGIEDALKAGNATEHTHRPALKTLIEELDLSIIATNEPKRIACGAPDYIVTRKELSIGYIEAKDVGKSLHEIERTEQLKRYKHALTNLILTDYLEFRWYVDGELRQEARLARPQTNGKLKTEKGGIQAVEKLLQNFLAHQTEPVTTPKDLAERMARLTHIIRDIIITAFETEQASNLLKGWREAFAEVLIADLGQPERTADFADMVAQTLAYGLFSARVMDPTPGSFSRHEAQKLIPKSNPFLRRFFAKITSVELDDEPFASFVNDLVELLANTDMDAVLSDFGKRTRQEDPVVHFYETFLAAYDPKLRESRGVYYTPEPVVSYIVRSVDYLLKTRFNAPQGLADSTKIKIPNYDPSLKVKGKKETRKEIESHKVLVLDPATGTGTFLYAVIDHIRQQFINAGNAGMWAGYVKNHLLPRLFGFELLMAPYAVAHFKLSLQLAGRDLPAHLAQQWAYHPAEGERLGVYLTDALEEAHEMTGLPLFTQWVSDETIAANKVKRHLPVLVVMGNPPYSNFGQMNKGNWIQKQIDDYKTGLDEKKLNLDDDFIKFIRFGQWRIEQSGAGILAFVTNNTYLDGITHRRMRESLLETFSEIYILNLHGSSMRHEEAPDGSKDENVFDIRQGVAISIFVKKVNSVNKKTKIYYSDLWGIRQVKYKDLLKLDVSDTNWVTLIPETPWWFFVPREKQYLKEYNSFPSVTNIFQKFGNGIGTDRDKLFYDFEVDTLSKRMTVFYSEDGLSPQFSKKYRVKDSSGYPILLRRETTKFSDIYISDCLYRPFDTRHLYYNPKLISRSAFKVMQHLQKPNTALLVTRQLSTENFRHVFVSKTITDRDPLSLVTRERTQVFSLYLYPTENTRKQKTLFESPVWQPDETNGGRVPNLNPEFVAEMEEKLGLKFIPNLTGLQDLSGLVSGLDEKFFSPEDIFHYIYAVFHSPTYRKRYAEFLKIDFPRVPITSDVALFRNLCKLGAELVGLHLLESPDVKQHITHYPIAGDNRVEKGYPKYQPPKEGASGRVQINKTQYFEGVPPEAWEFQIGGYQVLHKWLKDQRGRQLSYDDLTHYQAVVVSLQKTIQLMEKIDETIPEFPIKT